jgi:hypothetical protein
MRPTCTPAGRPPCQHPCAAPAHNAHTPAGCDTLAVPPALLAPAPPAPPPAAAVAEGARVGCDDLGVPQRVCEPHAARHGTRRVSCVACGLQAARAPAPERHRALVLVHTRRMPAGCCALAAAQHLHTRQHSSWRRCALLRTHLSSCTVLTRRKGLLNSPTLLARGARASASAWPPSRSDMLLPYTLPAAAAAAADWCRCGQRMLGSWRRVQQRSMPRTLVPRPVNVCRGSPPRVWLGLWRVGGVN